LLLLLLLLSTVSCIYVRNCLNKCMRNIPYTNCIYKLSS
jgi:hypothetical protein